MWLSEEGISIATNRTIRKLTENGQIGKDEKNVVAWNHTQGFDGFPTISVDGDTLVKLSSLTPTKEELVGGVVTLYADGSEEKIDLGDDGYTIVDDGSHLAVGLMFYVYPASGAVEPGIYTPTAIAEYGDARISLEWGTTTPIDPKYLPEPVEIDPLDYGVGLYQIFLNAATGNGKAKNSRGGTRKMWEDITANQNCVLLVHEDSTQDYVAYLHIKPACLIANKDGFVYAASFNFPVSMAEGSFITASITMNYNINTDVTTTLCAVSATTF